MYKETGQQAKLTTVVVVLLVVAVVVVVVLSDISGLEDGLCHITGFSAENLYDRDFSSGVASSKAE